MTALITGSGWRYWKIGSPSSLARIAQSLSEATTAVPPKLTAINLTEPMSPMIVSPKP